MTFKLLPAGPSSDGGEAEVVGVGAVFVRFFLFCCSGGGERFLFDWRPFGAVMSGSGSPVGGSSGTEVGSSGGSGSGRTGGGTVVIRRLGIPRRARLVGVAGLAVLLRRRRRGEVH